ncbi:MAG: alcohol dehydrogenase catalytic domain-containing protein [Proteobacteria bacterium]|nr:alcohol dehydrogenase catalytic domain-containing protein [Pseudomonadota bacterium]HQR03609.1 alcohol dehydrogenase catalytic domain-containing protein [Rhodocyclaceae bacterium]
MKAVRCCDRHVVLQQVPPPSGPGVRVRIAAAGICGSDLHMIASGFPLPATLGHEMAGITEDGTPVAIEPMAPCGHCAHCVAGEYSYCERGPGMIFGVGLDGGMAEEIVVPARALVPLPASIPVADACLVEPLAVAVHGVSMLGLRPHHRVAVIGGGSIGQCAVAAATASTAHVHLAARHDAQKLAGERLGAKIGVEGEYDFVIDCAGTDEAVAQAVGLCRARGTLLLLATYWGGLKLPAFEVCMKEIRILPASTYGRNGLGRDVDVAATLLAGRPQIARAIITHSMPLDAAVDAFAMAGNRAAGAIKVVLTP